MTGPPPVPPAASRPVCLVAVEMGYGHLRPAWALAELLGTEVFEVDRPPLASLSEARRWQRIRGGYEFLSRFSQLPVVGRPLRRLLDSITFIPRLAGGDESHPTAAVRALERLGMKGFGSGLVDHLRRTNSLLLTTFYAPAVLADRARCAPVVCVVTDSDINRIWVPSAGEAAEIHYCVPSERARRRLRAYGVRESFIHFTGFPLPPSLLGGMDLPILRRHVGERLVRLDPCHAFREAAKEELAHFLGPLSTEAEGAPPRLTFAVGGAGAQTELASAFLPSLATPLRNGRLRLTLVAGVRPEVADAFARALAANGLWEGEDGVEILRADSHASYFPSFNALLARTDILWTKPSELTFMGALGLPLVFSRPVGVHERANRRWARERGAALKQGRPEAAWTWLGEWLEDGTLAAAAWSGFMHLPKFGVYKIAEVVSRLAM